MKATFKGYIDIQHNAVFEAPRGVTSSGVAFSVSHFELRDDLNADQFVIGEEYEIDGLVKH